MMTDDEVTALRDEQIVQHYLMAGWLYNGPSGKVLMSDAAWDRLCYRVDAAWDALTHPHRDAIDRMSLTTDQTAMYLTDRRVPLMARCAAVRRVGGGVDPGVSYLPLQRPPRPALRCRADSERV